MDVLGAGAGAAVVAGDQDDLRARPWRRPEAMVPTPASDTNFTVMRALRLAFFRS